MLRIHIKDFQALQQVQMMYLHRQIAVAGLAVYWGSLGVFFIRKRQKVSALLALKCIRCSASHHLPAPAQIFNTISMNLFILDQQSLRCKMTAHGE